MVSFLEKISQDKNFTLEPTLTPSGLPVVSRATKIAFIQEIDRNLAMGKCSVEMLDERCKKIYNENRLVLESMHEIVQYFPPYMQVNIAIALTNMYLLLDSQGNRDKVYRYFSKPAD
jgi:hypothetical protein